MSTFQKNKYKMDFLTKKVGKYLVMGLVMLGIACIFLLFLKNSLNQEIFGSITVIIDEFLINFLNIVVILAISVPSLFFIKYMYNKNRNITFIGLIVYFLFIIGILCAFYILKIENFSVFPLMGTLFIDFFKSINNLLPFILVLPFLLFFYFVKIRTTSRYELTNLSVKNHIIVVDDGKKRNFKALIILQIQNIPKNIVVKEERTKKKAIEKLTIPGNLQYLHYHLTSLAKIIPNICFEIHVLNNDVHIRLILSVIGNEINDVLSEIETLKETVVTVFQTTFSGLKFEILQGNQLKNAWGDIFGGWGSYKYKFIDKNKVHINRIVENLFLSIIKFEDTPTFKIINNKSQIDALIRGLIGSHFDLNYIISARPMEIYDFEKQKHLIEKKAEDVGQEMWRSTRRAGNFEIKMRSPLSKKLEEDEIRDDLLNIRHAEVTGMWEVSGYIVLRSNDKEKLNVDTQKVIGLISTIFGNKLNILESIKLEQSFSKIPMRFFLPEPLNLTSEQLAIFFHLPENPIPSLSRTDIPEFEIPPERRVQEGISIGNVLYYDQEMYPFHLTLEDLRLNTFICGLIGMGKTRVAMSILKQLTEKYSNINWICLDWKGEYHFLMNDIKSQEILVFIPGSNNAPVELNMFDPQKSNADEHAMKLFSIIREIFKSEFNRESELSAQMESVCKEVLRKVVKSPNLRNLNSFINELKNYARENQAANKTIMMTVTALINQFDKFRHGVLKSVFDVKKSNIDFDVLMEKRVIINLNYLLTQGGAKEDVRLLMNLILKYVIDEALSRGITDTLKHLVIIEDAQLLIPSVLREVPETSLVEDILLLLRGVGESLITIATRPEVSSDIVANSGVKITFKSPYDSEKIARYQNLSEVQEKYLRIMPKREAIVTVPNYQFPFRIYSNYFEYQKHNEYNEIEDASFSSDNHLSNPKNILEKKNNLTDLKKPIGSDLNRDNYDRNMDNIDNSDELNLMGENNSPNFKFNIKDNEKQKNNKKPNFDAMLLFPQIQQFLKSGPKNKSFFLKELSLPKDKFDEILQYFIEKDKVLTCLAPIFNKTTKQRLYFLPEHKDVIKREIGVRLENDFLKNGKIGKLANEDNFDYIWYGNNTLIKILSAEENILNLDKINKLIINWFEEAIERESFELIVIVPFVEWSEKIRSWLEKFQTNQILIFAFNTSDWNKLSDYLNLGINPKWDSNFKNNLE